MEIERILEEIRAIAGGGLKEAPFQTIKLMSGKVERGYQQEYDISRLLLKHNCLYLLSKVTKTNEITKQLPILLSCNALTEKERYESCLEVFEKLNQIPYAVIKGAVLSQQIYGKASYRRSSDIDILIRREDADKVKKQLLSLGFVQGRVIDSEIVPFTRQELLYYSALSHQMAPFLKKIGGRFCVFLNIDVNLDIMWGESKKVSVNKLDNAVFKNVSLYLDFENNCPTNYSPITKKRTNMAFVLSELNSLEIYGVQVKVLTSVMELISLCLHHYKDMNSIYLLSQGSLKLSLFCDIYYYLIHVDIDIKQLVDTCNKLEVTEYVCYCIYHTEQIFKDVRLKSYLSALIKEMPIKKEEFDEYFNTYGLEDEEKQEWQCDIFVRLLDGDFLLNWKEGLSEAEQKKIETNRNFM